MRGLITIEKLRPDGYEYPVGLTVKSSTGDANTATNTCLLYTSPSPRDRSVSRMPSSA